MVRITENQTIPIILMLSISILATVLVTGTVINIVSAANSIKVQTKTIQHPVTRTTSPHIASSVARGKYLRGQGTSDLCGQYCPTQFFRMSMVPVGTSEWKFTGELDGELTWTVDKEHKSGYYGISHAPIILGVLAKDHHFGWQYPGQTNEDGTFSGTFHLCDNDTTKDHSFYFTVYFTNENHIDYWSAYDGGTFLIHYFGGQPAHPDGISSEGSTSWGPWKAQICASAK
jgi:hypothetical protein